MAKDDKRSSQRPEEKQKKRTAHRGQKGFGAVRTTHRIKKLLRNIQGSTGKVALNPAALSVLEDFHTQFISRVVQAANLITRETGAVTLSYRILADAVRMVIHDVDFAKYVIGEASTHLLRFLESWAKIKEI